jgi:hypothetical protein
VSRANFRRSITLPESDRAERREQNRRQGRHDMNLARLEAESPA